MTDHRDYDVKIEGKKNERPKEEWERRGEEIAAWLDARLGIRFWTLTGLVIASLVVGTPHLLIQYKCYGRCGEYATEHNCQYLGIRGWQTADPEKGKCPRLLLL